MMSPLKASYFLPSLGIEDAMALCRDSFLLAIASTMLSKGAFQ
jgi:hypothetical protein